MTEVALVVPGLTHVVCELLLSSVCEGLIRICPGSRSGSSVKPFSFSSLHLTVFGVLGGGNRIEATRTVHNFIKCAKAMKKRGPAYYFVLTVASFLHSYICMQNVL